MPAFIRDSLVLDFSPVAALASGVTENVDLTTVRGFDIREFTALPTATAANTGSAQLFTGGLAATDAVAMTTNGQIGRFQSGLTNIRRTTVAGAVIRVAFVDGGGGGGANGHAYATVLPNAIA